MNLSQARAIKARLSTIPQWLNMTGDIFNSKDIINIAKGDDSRSIYITNWSVLDDYENDIKEYLQGYTFTNDSAESFLDFKRRVLRFAVWHWCYACVSGAK